MTSSTRMPPESRLVIRSSSASSISGCAFLISLRTQLSLWRTSAMAWSTGEMEACAVLHAARGQKNVDPKVAFPFSRPACLLLGRPARANPRLRASFAVFAKLAVARQCSDFLGHLDSWTDLAYAACGAEIAVK